MIQSEDFFLVNTTFRDGFFSVSKRPSLLLQKYGKPNSGPSAKIQKKIGPQHKEFA